MAGASTSQCGGIDHSMTHDIFLSYKREDEARAARLAGALEAAGFTVWWDRSLLPATSWRTQIQTALETAKCVVVIWTRESAGPAGDFVRDEAGQAKARGVLVPVMMQKTRLPLGFGEMQYVDLVGWKGGRGNVFFQDLVAACRAKIDGTAVPKPKGPLRRTLHRASLGLLSTGGLAGLFALSANVASVQNHACSVAWVQPGVSDVCGALGLGGKPKRAERLAWEALEPGSCDALRTHVETFPDGAFRDDAADRIAARRVTRTEVWTPDEKRLRLMVMQDGDSAPDLAAAQQAAILRANEEAETLCRGFSVTSTFRLTASHPEIQTWDCADYPSGQVCGGRGEAVCDVDVRSIVETETCGAVDQP